MGMLEHCAPGYTHRPTKHGVLVVWNNQAYRLPKGPHGSQENVHIGTSQVRTMVRQLQIEPDCAAKHLPSLSECFK